MKYPIDSKTTETYLGHLVAHDRAQCQLVQALTILLQTAMSEMGMEDTEWYPEAEKLLRMQDRLKVDHENRIFNENNQPYSSPDITQNLGVVSGQITDPHMNANISEREKEFGEEMTEEDLVKHFREKVSKKSKNGLDLSKKDLTLEDIKDWERKQDNSNDIYKIKARVQNMVAATGGSLTSVGEMMVNSFVHVAKDLYDFAETIPDKPLKIKLIERIRKHESMPATLIAATSANVKVNK